MPNRSIQLGIVVIAAIIFATIYYMQQPHSPASPMQSTQTEQHRTDAFESNPVPENSNPHLSLSAPIENADNRINKKPFAIKIDPKTSPVQPERFSGYHTGTDFETTPEEATTEVKIFALCDGKLLQKRTASGYGGVMIQSCKINDEDVTIVYGHINITSVSLTVGQDIKAGDQIAVLGNQGPATDNERKHLHVGIHKGTSVNIKGYVQSQFELNQWIDYKSLHI